MVQGASLDRQYVENSNTYSSQKYGLSDGEALLGITASVS